MEKVKIYIEEDFTDTLVNTEDLEEYNRIKKELNLSCGNQLSDNSPIPYAWLDNFTINCLKILCPCETKLEDYTGQIPLKVLEHIKQSKSENYFDKIVIWDNRKDPDPIVVGKVYSNNEAREKGYLWQMDSHIIARFGAESKEVSGLIEDALFIVAESLKDEALKLKCKTVGILDYLITNPLGTVKKYLSDKSIGFTSGSDVTNILHRELGLEK